MCVTGLCNNISDLKNFIAQFFSKTIKLLYIPSDYKKLSFETLFIYFFLVNINLICHKFRLKPFQDYILLLFFHKTLAMNYNAFFLL